MKDSYSLPPVKSLNEMKWQETIMQAGDGTTVDDISRLIISLKQSRVTQNGLKKRQAVVKTKMIRSAATTPPPTTSRTPHTLLSRLELALPRVSQLREVPSKVPEGTREVPCLRLKIVDFFLIPVHFGGLFFLFFGYQNGFCFIF